MFKFKNVFSLLLSFCFLFVSIGSINAFASGSCGCDRTPIIFVNGMNSSPLLKNPGTPEEELIFPPSEEKIKSTVQNAVLPLITGTLTNGLDGLIDALAGAAKELLGDLGCQENGDLPADQGINWTYPAVGNPHDDYFGFNYDWRQDPLVSAEQLADYVEYIKRETGHDKVSFIGFSMGGTVLNAYLSSLEGDYSSIKSVIMEVSAANGASVGSEAYAGKITFDATALVRIIDDQLRLKTNLESFIGIALRALDELGLFDLPIFLINKLTDKYLDEMYDKVLAEIFGTMPGVWGLVSDEFYEEAKDVLLKDKEKYADLIARLDDYHYNVLVKSDEIARSLYEDPEVNFAIICKHNRQAPPVIQSLNASSDGTVNSAGSSYGATFADLDKTLGKNYVQAKVLDGRNYLSADNKVDASTGTVPQATWFIRDLEHATSCQYRRSLVHYILNSPTQVSVFDNPDFPQFAYYDGDLGDAFPITVKSEADPFEFLYDLGYGEAWFKLFARTATLIAKLT